MSSLEPVVRPTSTVWSATALGKVFVSATQKTPPTALRWGVLALSSALALSALAASMAPARAIGEVISEFDIPTGSSGALQIAAGPDGAMWFTESGAGYSKIGRVTTDGVFTEFLPPTPASQPTGIAKGPDGAMWFTELGANQIGRITVDGTFSEFAIPTAASQPYGIAAGPDGAMWFVESGNYPDSKIGRITVDGTFTEFPVPNASLGLIAAGPDGAMWFNQFGASTIWRITPAGDKSQFPISRPAYDLAAGPDGAIWFTEPGGAPHDAIGRITTAGVATEFLIPTAASDPLYIAAGPDGAMWFTEVAGNTIGRIAMDGSIAEFPLAAVPFGNGSRGPHGIAAGPDGALWFAELYANQIGRITPSQPFPTSTPGVPAETAGPSTTPESTGPPPDPFVRRSGTQLLLNGQPYRFSGVNIYNANSDDWCGYQYTDAELGAAFESIGSNGVVRAWFFQSQAASKSAGATHLWSGTRDWTRFDRTLAIAQQKGLRVIVTLTNQWDECGDGQTATYKSDAWYRSGYTVPDPLESAATCPLPADRTEPCLAHGYDYWVSYSRWVQEVVGRYANRPEILAWQLINEGEAKTGRNGICPVDDPLTPLVNESAMAAMKAWASDVSTLIHNLDSNHLVSLGTIGTGQCGAEWKSSTLREYGVLHDLPFIDLCEVHDDVNPTSLVPGNAFNGLTQAVARCNELQKPVFVGEIGIHPADTGGTNQGRADQLQAKIVAESAAGVVSHLAWVYNQRFPCFLLSGAAVGTNNPANFYDIGPADPALAILGGPAVVAPGAPCTITAAAGDGVVSVSWTPPANDGGASITQYLITSSPAGFSTTAGGATRTVTLSGLANGTPYSFSVKASNSAGIGLGSQSAVVTPSAGAPPPQTTIGTIPVTGATVATDPPGTVPTASNPLITTVTVPAGSGGGTVSIAETSVSGSPPVGYSFLAGQQVVITSTAATTALNPLKLVFSFDPALQPVIFRNGVPVTATCNPAGTATPTPCLSSGGPGTITVLTAQPSTWNVGMLSYTFSGFFSPVDNLPIVNVAKAGSAIPVKFGLGGDRGMNIFATGYPKSQLVACSATDPVDGIEQTVSPGAATLSFSSGSGTYQYVWRTEKGWAGTCRQFVMKLLDGTSSRATFKFN